MASTYRKELKQGAITVGYGHDHATGYFISVTDSRLEVSQASEPDLDALRYGVSKDGTGAYLDARTGTMDFGKRVSTRTMRKLWTLYGVEESQIATIDDEFAGL